MDNNNEEPHPEIPAVPEKPVADESVSQAESQSVHESSIDPPDVESTPTSTIASVACQIPEVEAPVETEPLVAGEPGEERRGFIKFLSALIGGIVSVIPFGAGIYVYLNPLTRKKVSSGDGFIKVTTLDAIPADGTPAKFSVIADKEDAWNKFKNISIGAVYLRRVDGKVKALHTVCPHLGCFIDYRPGEGDFFCPCHNSNFELNGQILSGVSPRAMDPLEIEVRNTSEVWVKFQNFQPGHDHPVPLS